jgi:hypothetical protein
MRKALLNYILVLAGPLISLVIIKVLQIPEDEIPYSAIVRMVIILAFITCGISLSVFLVVKIFQKAFIISVSISEILYIIVFIYFALSDPVRLAENFMWLPIMIMSVTAISLPMSTLISYGIGKSLRTIGRKENISNKDNREKKG